MKAPLGTAKLLILLPPLLLANAEDGLSLGVKLPGNGRSLRRLAGDSDECNARALHYLPPPSYQAYQQCFAAKIAENSTHRWEAPGAELAALHDCWCGNNMTLTMQDYKCCNHVDVAPMCTVDCGADCSSALATECLTSCPSMCLEVGEYQVDNEDCKSCDWTKCWPVLKCLTDRAANQHQADEVDSTCHEPNFERSSELKSYWDCWASVPKHSSHWNVLAAIRYCACRSNVTGSAERNSCCGSSRYGGGVCEMTCVNEAACATQEAQTCIQGCQIKCPSQTANPQGSCLTDCLNADAPCRPYLSCRPPQTAGYICDDGKFPESSSGCCRTNTSSGQTDVAGCPRLCTRQQVWRVDTRDTRRFTPWWARYSEVPVYQCTCDGCPTTFEEADGILAGEISDDIWSNGQMMLTDIARSNGLKLGANRQMQELMLERNAELQAIIGSSDGKSQPWYVSSEFDRINREYAQRIAQAAADYPDDGSGKDVLRERGLEGQPGVTIALVLTILVLCGLLVCAVIAALVFRSRARTQAISVEGVEHVVIGNPVPAGASPGELGVYAGTAVAGAANQKGDASGSGGGGGSSSGQGKEVEM